jgi:hypothetical protein
MLLWSNVMLPYETDAHRAANRWVVMSGQLIVRLHLLNIPDGIIPLQCVCSVLAQCLGRKLFFSSQAHCRLVAKSRRVLYLLTLRHRQHWTCSSEASFQFMTHEPTYFEMFRSNYFLRLSCVFQVPSLHLAPPVQGKLLVLTKPFDINFAMVMKYFYFPPVFTLAVGIYIGDKTPLG